MTDTVTLSVRALHVPFGHAPGLTDITFDVAVGERLVLLGSSGEGKTTLLRAIAGLAPVSSGHVLVRGRDVSQVTPEARNVVYLHQVPVLFPHLRVRDNVAFPLTVRGVSRREREAQVQPLLERLGLAAFADRLPHALSGGQRHRVALARALAAQPSVLLLDEPLAALDPALRSDVRRSIEDAHAASDAALVLVTHDLEDAAVLGDRVAVLHAQRVAQLATPAELFARPASIAVLHLLGVHETVAGVISTPERALTALGEVPIVPTTLPRGASVVVGVRAAALTLLPCNDAASVHDVVADVMDVHEAPNGPMVRVRMRSSDAAHVPVSRSASSDGGDTVLRVPVVHVPAWMRPGHSVCVAWRDGALTDALPVYPR
ncbi:MAG: ABC transporter ATP-binding protein [Gemmatimonadaceae bacterium]|jgi:putative spermidine/putrescine transport system ATP-binding protein|nr:ABC transporter ATP-binding protein [Gemmatimonadaceae bacterium]